MVDSVLSDDFDSPKKDKITFVGVDGNILILSKVPGLFIQTIGRAKRTSNKDLELRKKLKAQLKELNND